MSPNNYELRYLDAAVAELKPYLLSNEMYWSLRVQPPSGNRHYPPMTLGNLLLFYAKLKGRQESGSLKSPEETIFFRLEKQLDDLRQTWRTAWDNKVVKEFNSRIDQWMIVLDEMSNDPGNQTGYYKSDVRMRVLLELLASDYRKSSLAKLELLSVLDQKLKVTTKEAQFLWEEELKGVFGKEQYWFLYRMIK